jgi:hypothetical protein
VAAEDGEWLPPGEGVALAGPASQPQGVAAVEGEVAGIEGEEEPPGGATALSWPGGEARTASA